MLDRWALGSVHQLAETVDAAMEVFDTAGAGRAITAFIDDLSNWYVRRLPEHVSGTAILTR